MTFDVQRVDRHYKDLLAIMLKRKRDIDHQNLNTNNMQSYDQWLVDAVEALLQLELMRRGVPQSE